MNDYINIFIDKEYPTFLDKYLKTKTLIRLKMLLNFVDATIRNFILQDLNIQDILIL